MDNQPGKMFTVADRVKIVRLFTECQQNARETARRFAATTNNTVAPMTVIRINETFDATGSVADRPRSGRPKSARSHVHTETVHNISNDRPSTSTHRLSPESGIKQVPFKIDYNMMDSDRNGCITYGLFDDQPSSSGQSLFADRTTPCLIDNSVSNGDGRLFTWRDNHDDVTNDGDLFDLGTINDFQTLASQILVLQTQELVAQQLSEHESVTHLDVNLNRNFTADHLKEERCQSPEELFSCRLDGCCKEFHTLAALKEHVTSHSPDRKHPCPFQDCGRVFTKSNVLQYHKLTHTGERKFKCTYDGCCESFYTNQRLEVHALKHSGHRPFVCDYPSCCCAFATKGNLRNHLRTHTGEKPFVCKECGKGFAEKTSLKKHSAIHSGLRPYCCNVCGKAFTQSSTRRCHMSKKHAL